MSATWTTMDGRVLDIRWMDSQRLVNSFNLVARKMNLREDTAMRVDSAITPQMRALIVLRDEIRARGLERWTGTKQPAQLIRPDFRETHEQMCLMRAYLDAGVPWPGILDHHGALSCIRHQFESAYLSLSHCTHQGAGDAILAKYAEYRLMPKVNP